MVKYLFSIVTTLRHSKIISKVFTSKMNGKWKHYQKILFKKSVENLEEDMYYFRCDNDRCCFDLVEQKYGTNNDHVFYLNRSDCESDNGQKQNDFVLVAIQYHKWYRQHIISISRKNFILF